MNTRRIFISDIHLNSQSLYEREMAWFRPAHHLERLLLYLDRVVLSQAGQLDEVIFLGDTFDTWLAPMEEAPPTYTEILRSNQTFVDLVQAIIAAGVRVVFTPGNHDYDLDVAAIKAVFPTCVVQSRVTVDGLFHAEHGHEMTFFNTSAYDVEHGRPVGYYFGRLGESRLPDGHSPGAVWRYFRKGALAHLHKPDAMGHIIKTIFYDVAGLKPDDLFVLEHGEQIHAQAVVDQFALCTAHMTTPTRMWRMIQRPINLHGIAWALGKEHDVPLVILGHCHHELFTRMGSVLYANPGAWCQAYAHVVEVNTRGQEAYVQLSEVLFDGTSKVVRRQAIAT